MSLGYGGCADLVSADETLVMYKYCCYNVNRNNYSYYEKMKDGELYIDRLSFPEPELHQKVKKTASGRKKLIVKRVKKSVSLERLIAAETIEVKNASGTWMTTGAGTDIMALKLLKKIMDAYQETGKLPEHISLYG